MHIRLLSTGHQSAAMNMAIDEAVLLRMKEEKSAPTLRFYGWSPAAVSIGYFQSLIEELDLDACRTYGIDYVRRMTGGGAVLHEHEITYSFHLPETNDLLPAGILASYGKICEGITRGLQTLKLEPQFVPLNDIVLKEPSSGLLKKISGNAQTRKEHIILQHGTVLLKVDIEKMFSLLKVPSEKMKGKLIEDVKQRVTSVSWILGRELSFDEALEIFQTGFREAFPTCRFEPSELTSEELDLATRLYTEKYNTDRWNLRR